MDDRFINIHTHKPRKGINVVDPCLGDIQIPSDGRVYYSMGIHPVFIDGDTGLKLERIEQAARDKRIIAVGEAGLDRNSAVGMDMQQMWFERQVVIAARYGLPLIIHAVRAVPELIATYKKCAPCGGWIMHGFNNRREILDELLRHGFYISAGRHVFNEESNIFRLLPEIPADRLFIETDNSEYTIDEIYRKVAERRGESIEEMIANIALNFKRLFGIQV